MFLEDGNQTDRVELTSHGLVDSRIVEISREASDDTIRTQINENVKVRPPTTILETNNLGLLLYFISFHFISTGQLVFDDEVSRRSFHVMSGVA